MEIDQNTKCLSLINWTIEKIVCSLESGDLTAADPLFNINSFFSKIDLKKEKIFNKYKFKQLAEKILTMRDRLPENNKSKEFERNVLGLLNRLER